jgi:hypothetical protein
MLLYLLAFVGGVLTIVSPCILPVVPFVFSRADQPFRRSGLQQDYVSPEKIKQDAPGIYTAPGRLDVNNWGLAGKWEVGNERAMLLSAPGRIVFRFHARDLHLVLGPGQDGKAIRFRVLLDGSVPLKDHGADVDGQGNGTVKEYRLYQLIRQKGKVEDRTFQIEFLDPGVQAFAFTFG